MEVLRLPYCPSCGSSLAPTDRFCENCGAPNLWPPGYVPYAPVVMPQRSDHTALIVVGVVLVVVLALPALLYVIVLGLTAPLSQWSPPSHLGVTVSRSPDGSNWILTFTSVATGLSQNETSFALLSASGATMLLSRTLFLLEGSGFAGVRYVPVVTGSMMTTCAVGDRILVAYGTAANQYPAGTQVQITSVSSVLYAGSLQ